MKTFHKWTYAIIALIFLTLIGLFGYFYFIENEDEPITEIDLTSTNADTDFPKPSDENLGEMMYDHRGELLDVTNGSIRQTQFEGGSTGFAQAGFLNETYDLLVTFDNLPEPQNGDFYEGWVVHKSPLSIISTGTLILEDGSYTNRFADTEDLRDHAQYVLTLEPDDGDPAPDKHVLEGVMNKVIE